MGPIGRLLALGWLATGFVVAACATTGTPPRAPVCGFEVVNSYPHDTSAYTQGLDVDAGRLYESTGIHGRSSVREVDLQTGQVVRSVNLDDDHFGEGMTVLDGNVYQLTWRSGKGFVYDAATFERRGEFSYRGEGWGLTHDGRLLIMSDGTASLRFLDPRTFEEGRRLDVADGGEPVERLNELEYVEGEVYANIWGSDRIARIDPESGAVTAWIDLTGLLRADERTSTAEVLNGVAHDPDSDRLYVTGKFWPRLYEIRERGCPA